MLGVYKGLLLYFLPEDSLSRLKEGHHELVLPFISFKCELPPFTALIMDS